MPTEPAVLFNRLLARGRLRHLQLLVALADAGGVQRAAAVVGMSQPAATQALADLEELFGAALFERHTRGVRPTRFGQAVVPVARNVLQALRASTEAVAALQAGAQALLRLGCIPAAASGLLRQALPALLAAQPGLQVELAEENTDHLLPELAAGRLDAVLCRPPRPLPPHWRFELLQQDRPAVVSGPGHALAGRPQVPLAALELLPWILPPRGMGVRRYHEQLWAGRAAPRLHPLTTTSLPLVLEVLRTTPAVSLMPRSMVEPLLQWGVAAVLDVDLPELPEAALEGLGLLTTGGEDPPAVSGLRSQLRAAARP
ncbi:LysR substrate-binding domain-containing protein [Ramlibacter tataouinensis]|uniref:LysR substrate-binding domain-containing protein n=1 Tax=Ramlibacter tataouinensis TaxID=94132 RepID=UPI0022F383A1|nr:LysR substrate-binding domain-containing protein [Ramlibacter tataouinensis]WBY02356.1 LysR substrate-binding domain-containing protein [Ramlibacter tataouinensis]